MGFARAPLSIQFPLPEVYTDVSNSSGQGESSVNSLSGGWLFLNYISIQRYATADTGNLADCYGDPLDVLNFIRECVVYPPREDTRIDFS